MKGWCPRHDSVVSSDDGLCPRCGAALVVEGVDERTTVIDEAPDRIVAEPAPEEAVPAARRRPSVLWIAVAIAAAFLAGLAFPDVRSGDRSLAPLAREVSVDLNVGVMRNAAALGLRLESFTQRGRRIIARISVPPTAEIRPGDLRSAFVALRTGMAGGEIFVEMAVRVTTSGFILEGDVAPAPNVPILALRVDSLSLSTGGSDDVVLDLAGVWPVNKKTQPRARAASGRLEPVDSLRFAVTGLIGWADRLDVGLSDPTQSGGISYAERWELISGSVKVQSLQGSARDGLITFVGVPVDARRVTLRVTIDEVVIQGLWEWSLV